MQIVLSEEVMETRHHINSAVFYRWFFWMMTFPLAASKLETVRDDRIRLVDGDATASTDLSVSVCLALMIYHNVNKA